jgi:hypothetical protein
LSIKDGVRFTNTHTFGSAGIEGTLDVTNTIWSRGANSGLVTADRADPAQNWFIYGDGGKLFVYDGVNVGNIASFGYASNGFHAQLRVPILVADAYAADYSGAVSFKRNNKDTWRILAGDGSGPGTAHDLKFEHYTNGVYYTVPFAINSNRVLSARDFQFTGSIYGPNAFMDTNSSPGMLQLVHAGSAFSDIAGVRMSTAYSGNQWQMFTRNNSLVFGVHSVADYMIFTNSAVQSHVTHQFMGLTHWPALQSSPLGMYAAIDAGNTVILDTVAGDFSFRQETNGRSINFSAGAGGVNHLKITGDGLVQIPGSLRVTNNVVASNYFKFVGEQSYGFGVTTTNLTLNFAQGAVDLYVTNSTITLTNFLSLEAAREKPLVWYLYPQTDVTMVYPTLGASSYGVRFLTNANAPMWTTLTNGKVYVLSIVANRTNLFPTITLWQ